MTRVQAAQVGAIGVFELILLLVAAAVVGVAGWRVTTLSRFESDPDATGSAAVAAARIETPVNTPAFTGKQLTIAEYGIVVPLTAEVKDAYYTIDPEGVVYLADHRLDSQPRCRAGSHNQTADPGGSARLTKVTPGEGGQGLVWTTEELDRLGSYIDEAYFLVTTNQSKCTDDPALAEAATAVRRAFLGASKHLQKADE